MAWQRRGEEEGDKIPTTQILHFYAPGKLETIRDGNKIKISPMSSQPIRSF